MAFKAWFQMFLGPSYTQDLPELSCFVRVPQYPFNKLLFSKVLKKKVSFLPERVLISLGQLISRWCCKGIRRQLSGQYGLSVLATESLIGYRPTTSIYTEQPKENTVSKQRSIPYKSWQKKQTKVKSPELQNFLCQKKEFLKTKKQLRGKVGIMDLNQQ